MALKDRDVVNVMFGWIVEFIGWIFNMLIKLVIALIGGLFSLIGSGFKALFSKSENANNKQ